LYTKLLAATALVFGAVPLFVDTKGADTANPPNPKIPPIALGEGVTSDAKQKDIIHVPFVLNVNDP
jgi:hypothetical protein